MLVSLLVGLGVLVLVSTGLTGCSLLVFRLELFQLSLPPHGRLQLLLDGGDLTLQFRQFLNQRVPAHAQAGTAVPCAQSPALRRGRARPGAPVPWP